MDSKKLTEMRERADALGLTYHHRANAKTIEAAINAFIVAAEGTKLYPKELQMEQTLNEITAPSGGPPASSAQTDTPSPLFRHRP